MNLFDIVLDIERSISKFYDNRMLKGKIATPLNIWTQSLKGTILTNIIEINEISHLLFERYNDEYQKSIEQESNEIGQFEEVIATNLEEHFQISFEFFMILNNYTIFLEYEDKDKLENLLIQAITEAEGKYENLIQFYLNYPNLKTQSIANIVSIMEKQNSKFRLQQRLENFSSIDHNKSLELKLSLGNYYLTDLLEFNEEISSELWFEDYVLKEFFLNRAITILEEVELNLLNSDDLELKQELKDLSGIELPTARAYQKFNSAQLQTILAKIQLHNSDFQTASIDFKSALYDLDQSFNAIGMNPRTSRLKVLQQDAQKLYEEINLINLLVRLNLDFNTLLKAVDENNLKRIASTSSKMSSKLHSHDFSLDIQYLSALPSLYDNTLSTIGLLLSSGAEVEKISEIINQNFENMERRIVTATNQLTEDFNISPDQIDRINLFSMKTRITQIEILQLTNSLLPSFIPSKNHNQNRLLILLHLAKSLEYEIKAHEISKKSTFKEMIFKTKAYHHANLSYFEVNNLGTSNVPVERIKAHYSGSFIAANRLQINIYLSISQYLCLNRILPAYFNILSYEGSIITNNIIYDYWQTKISELSQFPEVLSIIIRSSQIIKEHRQIHGTVVQGINWDTIELIENVTRGILLFYQSLEELISGATAVLTTKIEDAVIHFDKAKQHGFKSANHLRVLSNSSPDLASAPSNVYNFAVYCQELSNNPKTAKLVELPVADAFKLLRDLVFAL